MSAEGRLLYRMSVRAARCVVLAAVLSTQPACVEEIQERCPLLTENRAAPRLPRDFAQLDGLLRHRAIVMWHDARQLNGSATRAFRITFALDTLPLLCARLEQARELAASGRVVAAGRKYQALLVLSQLVGLAIAMHATVESADQAKELSLTLARTQGTFGNQMTPLLEAALSEDPKRIEWALRQGAPAIRDWLEYLERWSTHIQADAERMKVAKAAWDITIGVIAAYETAGALAELAANGGPPSLSLPALGGGAAAMELSGAAYVDLAEAVRKLIASGALDAGVVAALSASTGGRPARTPPTMARSVDEILAGARPGRPTKGRAVQYEKEGGFEQANRDFDDLEPSGVRELPEGGRVGRLPGGEYVNVRPSSSSGDPTLEIQYPTSQIKIRYSAAPQQ